MKKLVVVLLLANITYFLWQIRSADTVEQIVSAPATASLTLLSETRSSVPTEEAINQVSPIPSPEAALTSENIVKECITLIGFIDQTSSEKAIEFLSEQNIPAKAHMSETQIDGDYLVYLPPFDSKESAIKKLRELQAQQIDSFIIGDGERTNGISLGVFSKEESAQKMQSFLKSKGYEPALGRSTKASQEYSLRLPEQADALMTEQIISSLSQNYAKGQLVRSTSSCD